MQVECACRGRRENCQRCGGSGYIERQEIRLDPAPSQFVREAAQIADEADSPNAPIVLNGMIYVRAHNS